MTPEQFCQLTDVFPEPTLLLDGAGTILAVNAAAGERFGSAAAAGRRLADVARDPPAEIDHYLAACRRSRQMVLGALTLGTPGGQAVPCRAEGAVVRPRSAEANALLLLRLTPRPSAVSEFVMLNRQIAELASEVRRRRHAEAVVAEQGERLRTTLASIGDAVITTDLDGRVTNLNAVAETLTGWKNDEAVGRPLETVFQIVNETTRQPVENPAQRALREGMIVGLANHTVLIARNGSERPIDDSAAPIRCRAGAVVGCVLIFRDVSERRRTERALADSAQRLRFVLESMPQKIFTATADGRLDYFNPQWTGFTGRPVEEPAGSWWHSILHPDDREATEHQWRAAVADSSPFRLEHRFRGADGAYYWHVTRAVPLHGANGSVTMWVGSSTDIHEQKETAEELRRIAAALSETDRRKDEFLATLAHELRNPLAPIRNAVHILKMAGGDRRLVEQTREMMERQVQQMVRLVDDLLDLSRVTRGTIELRKERVDLAAVVASAVETSRPLLETGRHTLHVTLPPQVVYVDADVTRLAQVFANLLNNSAKYTPPGGNVWLTAARQGVDAVVSVRDDGIGIPPQMLPHVFEMFAQVDRSLERSQGGLGIGLTLVKRLVELHGGSVEGRSAGHGLGSEFTVRLAAVPTTPAEDGAAGVDSAAAPAGGGLLVLVADDNEDAANSLGMLLQLLGYAVQVVHDGVAAVATAATLRPAVVLLDIGMPNLNGYEAARRLREQDWGRRILLIALTGWGQEEDKRRSREAGFDHHLVKPVDPAALQALLATAATREC